MIRRHKLRLFSAAGERPRIDWTEDAASHVIAIHGEVDLDAHDELARTFARALDSRAAEVVLDLEFCRFIDSYGVAAIVGLDRRLARSSARRLRILPGPPAVQRTFATCGLLEVLDFHE